MKTTHLAAITLAATISSAHAVTIAFDVGPAGGLDGDGGLSQTTHSGEVWNNFGAITGLTDHFGVQDTLGNELAGVTLAASGVGGRDGNGTLNAGWGGTTPQAVIDSWYFSSSPGFTLTLKGLTPGSLWNVEVSNAFNTATNLSDITVNSLFADGTAGPSAASDGDDWDRKANGFDAGANVDFNSVAADGSGHIVISFQGGNPTTQGLVFTSVPEPSSTALIGLGGLAMILRRRK